MVQCMQSFSAEKLMRYSIKAERCHLRLIVGAGEEMYESFKAKDEMSIHGYNWRALAEFS